jgi:tetraacyldisaccharide 4'-kinase
MRAPDFWSQPPGLLAALLTPAGAVWQAAGGLRRAAAQPYRASVPVLCVGNLVAGGAGKTPVALSLAACLVERGAEPHVVVRGYGGGQAGPLRVDPERHNAAAVGDEALLLAARVPCWVGRDRAAAVRAAVAGGAGAIVLDDGLQNPTVTKDLSLVVIDAGFGFGNGRVIPAGPLREPVAAGLARADAIVLLDSPAEAALPIPTMELPVLHASIAPIAGERLAGERVYAFAGIGRPEKFFAMLRRLDAVVVGVHPFPDHHPFRSDEIAALHHEAASVAARLVTTAKDFVRLPPALRGGIAVLEIAVLWRDPAALAGLVAPIVLSANRHGRRSPQARG